MRKPSMRKERLPDKDNELGGVMTRGLHLKPRPTPNQRTTRDQQLDEHRDRVRLRVGRKRINDISRETMINSRSGRLRPTRWDR